MFTRNLRSGRRLAALAIFSVIAVSAFGFAATNTVPASKAGDGSGGITGYTVSGITYSLDSANPSNISGVSFTLSAPAGTVRAGLNAGATVPCSPAVAPNSWNCGVSGATSTALSLTVAAAD